MTRPLLPSLVLLLALAACRDDADFHAEARGLTQGGDPRRGRALIQEFGCGSCHVIPGVPGAYGGVGPSLDGVRDRMYIAGRLPHSPENLMKWIEDPQLVDSLSAMPDLGVSHGQARDIAAYLYAAER